jgi:hypothetical protein
MKVSRASPRSEQLRGRLLGEQLDILANGIAHGIGDRHELFSLLYGYLSAWAVNRKIAHDGRALNSI